MNSLTELRSPPTRGPDLDRLDGLIDLVAELLAEELLTEIQEKGAESNER